jgi:predicted nucleic acid-binding protein
MITAVDTSVLLDILTDDPEFGSPSVEALRHSIQQGRIVACSVVWAKTAAVFPDTKAFQNALAALPLVFSSIVEPAARFAGEMWRQCRREGGARHRAFPDFLIAAHVQFQSGRLLTRNCGFFRTYFKRLSVFEPSSG